MLKKRFKEWGARRNRKRPTGTQVSRQQVRANVSVDTDMKGVDKPGAGTAIGDSIVNPTYFEGARFESEANVMQPCLADMSAYRRPPLDALPAGPLSWPMSRDESAGGMSHTQGTDCSEASPANDAAANTAMGLPKQAYQPPRQHPLGRLSCAAHTPTFMRRHPSGISILGASGWLEPRPMYNPPEAHASPHEIRKLFLRYCNETNTRNAEAIANQVHFVFRLLLIQQHQHALTVLNAVLATMYVYNQTAPAFELLRQARNAAWQLLSRNNPLVWVIDYMMMQAEGEYTSMSADILRQGHEEICSVLGAAHPHSLVAGYLLAWRLAADDDEALQVVALQHISRLQSLASGVLRETDMLWIAMLMLKARLRHSLGHFEDGVRSMCAALRGMSRAEGTEMLYVLSARGRLADLHFAAERLHDAEREYIASAAGQVQLRGSEHPATREAIRRARFFFRVTGRDASLFTYEVYLAEKAWTARRKR